MAFVRIWSEENFLGTATVLSVGPTNLYLSSVTIKSVEVAPYFFNQRRTATTSCERHLSKVTL